MPAIAISYRRSDSQDITGRLFDRLASTFGPESVFRDIDSVRPGIDFRMQISEALSRADILLVIVGPTWLGGGTTDGHRIHQETDFVRIEVESALERNIPVIPVLVNGAKMPGPTDLPISLQNFAFRHALPVDGGQDFDHHVSRLIRNIENLDPAKRPADARSRPRPTKAPGSGVWGKIAIGGGILVLLCLVAGGALWLGRSFAPAPPAADLCSSGLKTNPQVLKGYDGTEHDVYFDFTHGIERMDPRACGREYWLSKEKNHRYYGLKLCYLVDGTKKRVSERLYLESANGTELRLFE